MCAMECVRQCWHFSKITRVQLDREEALTVFLSLIKPRALLGYILGLEYEQFLDILALINHESFERYFFGYGQTISKVLANG